MIDAMAAAGIKFDFVTSASIADGGAPALASYVATLQAFQAAHPGAILTVEGLNEANVSNSIYDHAFTMEAAAAFQKALYGAVKGAAGLSNVSVINLSISHDSLADYKALGDLGQYSDFANAHAYPHTGTLGDPSMEYSMGLAQGASSKDPLIVTETGYTTYQSAAGLGASETAQAKLILNNLLNAYENGSQKTYIHTLLDTSDSAYRGDMEVYFGLFHEDGTPKLAATALHNFTTILRFGDDGTAKAGTVFDYALSGAPDQTHSMVMQKSAGVYDIVVWRDTIVWDEKTKQDLTPRTANTSLDLGKVQSVVYVYDPLKGTAPIATYHDVRSITLPLSDHALIVEIGAKGPVVETPPQAANSKLTMTSADFVAKIDTLAQTSGIQSITLSDSQVLKVSSVETMKHIIQKYGALLSKVAGDTVFSVTYGEATWQKVQTFDEAGNLLSRTDYGLSNGKIVSECKVALDGSFVYTAFNIVGRDYTIEKQTVNAKGQVTDLLRSHADGTPAYREVTRSDGKEYLYYNAKGALLNDVTVALDGSRTTLTYDAVTGKLARMIVAKDGNIETTTYSAGVKTGVSTLFKSGAQETATFDSVSGKVTSDVMKNADGSSVTKLYVNGVLSRQYEKYADGSQKNYINGLTGKTYVNEVQTVDAKGNLIDILRSHADGSLAYREKTDALGNKHYMSYDAQGRLLGDATVATDGTRTTLSYDVATGKMTQSSLQSADGTLTVKTFVNGVLTAQAIKKADGSADYTSYNKTGLSYATLHQVVDKAGKIVLLERVHADGTFEYREITKIDGGKQFLSFNPKGALLNDVTVGADGSRTTLTYDAATGTLSRTIVEKSDSAETTTFIAGIKTAVSTLFKSGVQKTLTFDAAGKVASDSLQNADGSSVTKLYVNGVLSRQFEKSADGSQKNAIYGLTDKTYTGEVQTLNAAGKMIDLLRVHADGTPDYHEISASDGSKEYLFYDAKGNLLNDVTVDAAGNRTTLTYDATIGKLARMIVEKDGNVETTTYSSGVKSGVSIQFKSGAQETVTFDATSGKVTSDIVKNADGSGITKLYVDGVLSRQYEKYIDGSQKNSLYGLTGKTYVTEVQTVDAKGNLIDIQRSHADGSPDYREITKADGTKEYLFYDAKGALLNDVTVGTDGGRTTLAYDALTGKMAQSTVQAADGTLTVKTFVAGILTAQTIKAPDGSVDYMSYNKVGLSYTTVHQVADKAGNITLLERLHADGTFDYREERHADGSKDFYYYDVKGQITAHVDTAADNSRVVDTYLTNGTGDIRTDSYDNMLKLLVSNLAHSDGSHDITLYADKQTFHGGAGSDTIQFRNTVSGSFVYEGGKDTLVSFNLVNGAQDHVVLDKSWAGSFSDLHLSQQGLDTVISFDKDDSIVLSNTIVSSVTADHFFFV
ncbi:hypothetical protein BJF92_24230 [Rhizobium rhizosphaerae]|uniref:RHS repeat protein n=1 Tax=Xaviernesmea rhizosphaerae TaxID=1672749 RepID=A0A1Q9AQ65_9HYPH|nr:hypothetical protein [Xaviernesmea rhizosphaerae]OLP57519.1 hypothetical protein BJF92_24230 [Xaviernesmea rhizosphaerae]